MTAGWGSFAQCNPFRPVFRIKIGTIMKKNIAVSNQLWKALFLPGHYPSIPAGCRKVVIAEIVIP